MSGTKAGGKKAAKTNKERYGEDFYKVQGAKGGRNGPTGGFASDRELARIAGAKGGKKSRRTGVRNGEGTYKRRVKKAVIEEEPTKKKGLLNRIFGRKDG